MRKEAEKQQTHERRVASERARVEAELSSRKEAWIAAGGSEQSFEAARKAPLSTPTSAIESPSPSVKSGTSGPIAV